MKHVLVFSTMKGHCPWALFKVDENYSIVEYQFQQLPEQLLKRYYLPCKYPIVAWEYGNAATRSLTTLLDGCPSATTLATSNTFEGLDLQNLHVKYPELTI